MTAITHTTKSAFLMAFHRTLQAAWPTVTAHQSNLYCDNYLDVPFGTHGYDWSVMAAIELAKAYIAERGE